MNIFNTIQVQNALNLGNTLKIGRIYHEYANEQRGIPDSWFGHVKTLKHGIKTK